MTSEVVAQIEAQVREMRSAGAVPDDLEEDLGGPLRASCRGGPFRGVIRAAESPARMRAQAARLVWLGSSARRLCWPEDALAPPFVTSSAVAFSVRRARHRPHGSRCTSQLTTSTESWHSRRRSPGCFRYSGQKSWPAAVLGPCSPRSRGHFWPGCSTAWVVSPQRSHATSRVRCCMLSAATDAFWRLSRPVGWRSSGPIRACRCE